MKNLILFGALALGLNFSIRAQQTHPYHTDYKAMALRDALHEQNLVTLNEEDADDYVDDQKNFEIALRLHDKYGYFEYIMAKQNAYGRHKKKCKNRCNHGPLYYNLVSYYDSIQIYDPPFHPQNQVNPGEIYQ